MIAGFKENVASRGTVPIKVEVQHKRSPEVFIVNYTPLINRDLDSISTSPGTKRYDRLMDCLATEQLIYQTLIDDAIKLHDNWEDEKLLDYVNEGLKRVKSSQKDFVPEKDGEKIINYLNGKNQIVISSIEDYTLSEIKYLLKLKHDLPSPVKTKF